ncbi:MAG TPA: protein kinase [Aggregatilineales bacterium]|nr:protein kinase [Aggregatilineales bacterium]
MVETVAHPEVDGETLILVAQTGGTQQRRLIQPWLSVARTVWVILLIVNLAVLAVSAPLFYSHRHTLCNRDSDPTCGTAERVPLSTVQRWESQGFSWDFMAGLFTVVPTLTSLVFILVGLFIFVQRSDDWFTLLASSALMTAGAVTIEYTHVAIVSSYPALSYPMSLLEFLGVVLLTLFAYLFPDGHFSPRWMRWVALAVVAWYAIAYLIPNSPIGMSAGPVFYLPGLAIAFSMIYRYRHPSTLIRRQQTKWVVFGAAVTCFGVLFVNLLRPMLDLATTPEWVFLVLFFLDNLILWLVLPLSLAVAILHYRLWDVDFLINRSLVYGALTVLLVAVLGISLLVVSHLFQDFNGGQQSGVAIGATALAFGMMFQSARRRLQGFVDRRFYGIRIDYQQPRLAPVLSIPAAELPHFGMYDVLDKIGQGGMAEVYKGRHTALDKPVAIKVLPQALIKEGDFRQRFEREARTVGALKHPNIVQVTDFGEASGAPYMVMEYIGGQDLADFLRANGKMSLSQALPVLTEIASALDYAHSQGIVHRDIKASNIMLEPITATSQTEKRYRAVLMDFGIAKIVGGGTRLTQHNVMGTLDYIAPEQIQAAADVDGRADVYSLGVLTYQMLTGELPFKSANPGALLLAHLQQPPPDPRSVVSDLPDRATKAILRALAKSPADRFPTAGEFVKALY